MNWLIEWLIDSLIDLFIYLLNGGCYGTITHMKQFKNCLPKYVSPSDIFGPIALQQMYQRRVHVRGLYGGISQVLLSSKHLRLQ